jgi:hypothetical protein
MVEKDFDYLLVETMRERPITKSGWHDYEIEVPVPATATAMFVGGALMGRGSVCFDWRPSRHRRNGNNHPGKSIGYLAALATILPSPCGKAAQAEHPTRNRTGIVAVSARRTEPPYRSVNPRDLPSPPSN